MKKLLDTSSVLMDSDGMKGVSTAQAAQQVGVTTRTLFRWLDTDLLPEPRRVKMPGQLWRLWSPKDIARAQKLKAKIKRGPKSRRKKRAS